MTRRDFICAGGAATAATLAGCRMWAAAEGLPEYYGDHIAHVTDRIRRLSPGCEDGFFFVTDLHFPSNRMMSGRILARLVATTGLKKVFCGGDIPESFGTRETLDAAVDEYRAGFVGAVERAGGEFFPAKGNHDFNIRGSRDDKTGEATGISYPGELARRILMDTAAVRRRAVVNEADPEGVYYYVDEPHARIRYIVADGSDRATAASLGAKAYGMSDEQVAWLAGNALGTMHGGWTAVVVQHAALGGVAAPEGMKKLCAKWREVMEACNAGGRVSVGGREFDFSGAKISIAMNLTGHYHAERQSKASGIWHVTQPCDAAYRDYIARSLWCPGLPKKDRGTVFEQTFDAVQISLADGLIHFTRIGGGGDRTLHAGALRLSVGEKAALSAGHLPECARPLWRCCDADGVDMRAKPGKKYDYDFVYGDKVAEVSPDGVVKAKGAGEAVVAAIAPNGDKELFPVLVA